MLLMASCQYFEKHVYIYIYLVFDEIIDGKMIDEMRLAEVICLNKISTQCYTMC